MTLTTRTAATHGLGRCVGRDCADNGGWIWPASNRPSENADLRDAGGGSGTGIEHSPRNPSKSTVFDGIGGGSIRALGAHTHVRLRIRDSALQYGKVSPENRQGREDGASGTQPVKALDFRHTVPTGQEEREFELLGRSVDRRRLRVLGSGQ